MRAYTCTLHTLVACFLAVGCTTTNPDTLATDNQGLAEIRAGAAPLLAAGITRVTAEAAGVTQELTFSPGNGTFDGALVLPSGTQSLIVRAFSGEILVGASTAVSVDVQPGAVTRVLVRILDLRVNTPVYGPIVDSLTFPTTVEVGEPATFAIAIVAPANEPVTYDWSSSCADSTFSAPQSATTSWSSPAEGTCTINVVATSNGFTVTQSFVIVVFPAGANSGAVNVSGVFVAAPGFLLDLANLNCHVASSGAGNSSCSGMIASPSTDAYFVTVFDWGGSTPGTIEVSDNCGGRVGTALSMSSDFVRGNWLPPVDGGLCIVTARVVNGDGVAGTASAAILTRAGTPATAKAPVSVSFGNCLFSSSDPVSPADCGRVPAGTADVRTFVGAAGMISWTDGILGTATFTDSCGGGQFQTSQFAFVTSWEVTGLAGTTCNIAVNAVNWQGVESVAAGQYLLF